MIIAKLVFGTARSAPDVDPVDVVETYLASLVRNGQASEYLLSSASRSFEAFVEVPRPDALRRKHLSKWGRNALRNVRHAFGHEPSTALVAPPARRRWPSWQSADALYLFTHAFDRQSPVVAFNSREPLPLYALPISDQLREDVRSWAREYADLDRVWLGSGPLEMAAYKQLADPSSHLSRTGRDLCAKIGRATRRRTYYYLTRYYGRQRNDDARPCPGCGGAWHVVRHHPKTTTFARFEFCCRRCRLVSHTASSPDGDRAARIGEFHSTGRGPTKQ